MDENAWWYSVTDLATGGVVEDSHLNGVVVTDGSAARKRCEEAGWRFLGVAG